MIKYASAAALSLSVLFSAGAAASTDTTCAGAHAGETKTILQTAQTAGSFTILADLLAKTGLDKTFDTNSKDRFTVFAPTDDAFKALGSDTLQTLSKPESKQLLAGILKYHVVSGSVMAADVKTGPVATLNGQRIDLVAKDGKVTADKARVVKTDIACSNGVIHVIDAVMLPSDKDIVATAVGAKLNTLVSLVKAADLAKALSAPGNFTVFAPSDEAFAKLDKATVESLTRPENKDTLAKILKYHVIPDARVFSNAAGKPTQIKTLAGTTVTVEARDGNVYVNGAKVIKADVDTTNGVVHVIDTVLLPE